MSEDPVISRSPRGTIIVRVKRSAQVAAVRVVAAPLFKAIAAGVALVATAVAAWRC